MNLQALLDHLGLTTRDRLDQALAKKELWHGLVRDVFARYYLKFRESLPDQLPDLPRRYSPGWEQDMKKELDHFLALDLYPVSQLLRACGFGTQKWEQFVVQTLPELEALIDAHLSGDSDNGRPLLLGTDDHELEAALKEAREEIRKLRIGGRRALERLKSYEQRIQELQADLEERGEPASAAAEEAGGEVAYPQALERENQELKSQLADRERTIAALNNQLEDLEGEMALRPQAPGEAPADPDDLSLRQGRGELDAEALRRRNEELQKQLRAREHSLRALRGQLENMEKEMGTARDQLLGEVKKLGELASGAIQLKPSEELEAMDADELLSYAREVAGDLDVRKQTFAEGLNGLEALKTNYEQSRDLYQSQQEQLREELEKMTVELQTYQEQARQAQGSEELEKVVATQRRQLQVLSGRIKELSDANKNLNESNQKMFKDLETAVKRVMPLRRQIEELESLRDTLTTYIRQKYDRTFTIRALNQ